MPVVVLADLLQEAEPQEDPADPQLILNVWLALGGSFFLTIMMTSMTTLIMRCLAAPPPPPPTPSMGGAPPAVVVGASAAVAGETAAIGARLVADETDEQNRMQRFLLVEFLDVASENAGLALIWAEGDLDFSNDHGMMKAALLLSNVLSLVAFVVELCLYWKYNKLPESMKAFLRKHLLALKFLHLGIEDLWQFFLYSLIGASQAQETIGNWTWVAGAVQCLAFFIVRVVESRAK